MIITTGNGTRAGLEAVAGLNTALGNAAQAYVAGVLELGRFVGGVGREIAREGGEHVRATGRARSLRELAELQAAWTQHRIEMSATHAKELADLARMKAEAVIAPLAGLLRHDEPA